MAVMTDDEAHALIGELAQIIVGYEPVSAQQLRDRAVELVEIAKNHQVSQELSTLAESIRNLSGLLDDIESEA